MRVSAWKVDYGVSSFALLSRVVVSLNGDDVDIVTSVSSEDVAETVSKTTNHFKAN